MVNIISPRHVVVDADQVSDQCHHITFGQHTNIQRSIKVQSLVGFVAPHLTQVVASGVEEPTLEILQGIVQGRWVAGPHEAEEFHQRLLSDILLGLPRRLHPHGSLNVGAIGHDIHFFEEFKEFPVASLYQEFGILAIIHCGQRSQEDGYWDLALAVDLDHDIAALAGLELQPGPPIGDQFGLAENYPRSPLLLSLEIYPWGADQLTDDNPLCAIDDEGPTGGHAWEIAEEDL